MNGDAGGRQEVSSNELRALADSAGVSGSNVLDVRDRVSAVVSGVDRRGWNSGGFDSQWASTGLGISRLGLVFGLAEADLLDRATLADLLNSRGVGIGPDGLPLEDPVNSHTGNFIQRVVDLRLPTRGGLPLAVARTYNSRDERIGLFGQGWTSTLEWKVVPLQEDHVLVLHPDGHRALHVRRPRADETVLLPTLGAPHRLFARGAAGWRLEAALGSAWLEFDPAGQLERIGDANGNRLTLERDTRGQPTRLVDAAGQWLGLVYNLEGLVAEAHDGAGRQVSYTYDRERHLVAITDACGAVSGYTYDGAGLLASVIDARGITVLANRYDAEQRVVEQRDALGACTRIAYRQGADGSVVTTLTDARGNSAEVSHDGRGLVTRVVDPLGESIEYTYDLAGRCTRFRDRNGHVWAQEYAECGLRSAVVAPDGARVEWEYDGAGRLVSRTDALGGTWRWVYDERGNLVRAIDPEGGLTHIGVDSLGLPVRIQDPDGVAVDLAYNAAGLPTHVSTDVGETTSSYDTAGQLVERSDPAGNVTRFTYDAVGRLLEAVDARGLLARMTYDAVGHVLTITGAADNTTTLTWDAAGRLEAKTDALGARVGWGYDASGNRTWLSDPNGHTIRFAYDPLDRLVEVLDQAGGAWRTAYDPNGNVVRLTDPKGGTANLTYSARDELATVTDRLGRTAAYAYDAAGRLSRITDAGGSTTELTWDGLGRPRCRVDALGGRQEARYSPAGRLTELERDGSVNRLEYDRAGRPSRVVDALDQAWQLRHDAAGRLVARTDPGGYTTRFERDVAGRVRKVVDALGGTTSMTWGAGAHVASVVDALGVETRYEHDALDRLTRVVDGLGSTTRYTYDLRGLLVEAMDAHGHARSFEYDAASRLRAIRDPLGRTLEYEYDPNHNLARVVDPLGETAYVYDAEDRAVEVRYADGSQVDYRYDAVGNRVAMLDALGTTTYQYDALWRPTAVTDPFGLTLRSAYDDAGRRSELTYPDGRTVAYAYDPLGRVSAVRDWSGNVARYAYDAVGNATSAEVHDGLRWQATYDPVRRLRELVYLDRASRPVAAFEYDYDCQGNVIAERERVGAQWTERQLTYDALNRLTRVVSATEEATFELDAVGNRVAAWERAADETPRITRAAYDAANQLLCLERTGSPTTSLRYDKLGRIVERADALGTTRYRWNAAGRLVDTTRAGGPVVGYRYDGDGELREEQRAGQTSRYSLDMLGPLSRVLMAECSGESTRSPSAFVHGLGPMACFDGERPTYPIVDLRGSVRGVADANGDLVSALAYDVWGTPRGESNATSGWAQFGFSGARQDPTFGLIDLGARWYAPDVGQFLSRDPFGGWLAEPLSQHPYLYANGNPATLVDPTGLSAANVCPVTPPANEGHKSWWDKATGFAGDFFGGVASGGADFAKGLWGMGSAMWNSGLIHAAYDWDGFVNQWQSNYNLGKFIYDHPGDFAGGVYHGFVDPYTEAWRSGHPGAAFGRGTFDIASIIVGTKGLDKLSKLSKVGRAVEVARVAEPTGEFYSVGYRVMLDAADLGKARGVHFRIANTDLEAALASEAEFERAMEQMIPGVRDAVSPVGGRKNPPGWTWNHGVEPGALELVPRWQHTPGSIFWRAMHPDGRGGYSIWAIPRGAPPNR